MEDVLKMFVDTGMFAGGDGNGEGVGVYEEAMAFKGWGGLEGLGDSEDNAEGEGGNVEVVEGKGCVIQGTKGHDPVVGVIVGEGVGGGVRG